MATKPIPEGYHSITPYLIVNGAAKAIDFYKLAFGAVELMRMPGPDGKLGHAEIRIGRAKDQRQQQSKAHGLERHLCRRSGFRHSLR